jgi:hypothetical protein
MRNTVSISNSYTRRLSVVSCCLVASAFGPYLLPHFGLRLDHVVVYGLFFVFLCAAVVSELPVWLNPTLLVIIMSLGAAIIWTTVATVFGDYPLISRNRDLASFVRFSQPMAVVAVMAFVTQDVPKSELSNSLRLVSMTICVFMNLNAVLAACQLFWDTSPVAHYFLRSLGEPTVWEVTASQGRYSGIFDQPIQNGLAYSMALISWVYFVSHSRSLWPWVLFPLLVLGGTVGSSKVFLFAGLPAATLYLLFRGKSGLGTYFQALVGLVAATVVLDLILREWVGMSFFSHLIDPSLMDTDPLGLYTGGRFGTEGQIFGQFSEIWGSDPLCGRGFGTAEILDNGYLEFFWQGGLVGLVLYILIIATIAWAGIRGVVENEEHGFLVIILCTMVIGAGFGGPALTLNRSSILVWVFMSLAIVLATSTEPDSFESP